MNNHEQPPETIKEVGIHIGYMRDDITELKLLLERNIEIAATKAEVEKLASRVRVLEQADGSKKYITRLEGAAVGTILAVAISILTLWNLVNKS